MGCSLGLLSSRDRRGLSNTSCRGGSGSKALDAGPPEDGVRGHREQDQGADQESGASPDNPGPRVQAEGLLGPGTTAPAAQW